MYNWDYENDQWKRNGKKKVALKCLHDSQDITADFLKEIESNILVYSLDPLKRPNASELQQLIYDLWNDTHNNNVNSVIYRQVKETDDINKKLSSSMIQSSLSSTKPKNADNDDLEYSDSLKMDFTKD
ncbi:kinase-like domain-containing protein [Rhizophagus irregularis DAOM 181602=DAOM 197198]|nr:kinase-like domain-containing protein [Rhizophagus irregularis DAOM 181602=DAOM 197198]